MQVEAAAEPEWHVLSSCPAGISLLVPLHVVATFRRDIPILANTHRHASNTYSRRSSMSLSVHHCATRSTTAWCVPSFHVAVAGDVAPSSDGHQSVRGSRHWRNAITVLPVCKFLLHVRVVPCCAMSHTCPYAPAGWNLQPTMHSSFFTSQKSPWTAFWGSARTIAFSSETRALSTKYPPPPRSPWLTAARR